MAVATQQAHFEAETGQLTPAEVRHLQALERRVERGMRSFRDVGEALLEIRDKRLFRMSHPSFESYVSQRWGLERARAYQLMGAAEVVDALPNGTGRFIVNEVQARELVPIYHSDPKLLTPIMEDISHHEGPITGPVIREVVRKYAGGPDGANPPPSPATTLIALLTRTATEYEKWMALRPSRADKALVREAVDRLKKLLSG